MYKTNDKTESRDDASRGKVRANRLHPLNVSAIRRNTYEVILESFLLHSTVLLSHDVVLYATWRTTTLTPFVTRTGGFDHQYLLNRVYNRAEASACAELKMASSTTEPRILSSISAV